MLCRQLFVSLAFFLAKSHRPGIFTCYLQNDLKDWETTWTWRRNFVLFRLTEYDDTNSAIIFTKGSDQYSRVTFWKKYGNLMHLSNTRLNFISFESLYLGLYELTVRKSSKWSHFYQIDFKHQRRYYDKKSLFHQNSVLFHKYE